jgi:hypothetical protein
MQKDNFLAKIIIYPFFPLNGSIDKDKDSQVLLLKEINKDMGT